jgi:alpha-D-ribose 1-methylphosphonate 5-triphosphate diphosphatase
MTLLTNAKLVLADEVVHGSVNLDGAHIRSVDSGVSSLPGGIDLEGDYLWPGMVEVHTDNFERHLMPRPAVRWDDAPALLAHDAEIASSGITTVLDALGVGEADPDSVRGSEWDSVLAHMAEFSQRDLLRADHFLHVRCELPAPNTLGRCSRHSKKTPWFAWCRLMDHTPGQRQWENIQHAWIYFSGKKGWSQAKFDARVAQAREDQVRYAQPHRAFFDSLLQGARHHPGQPRRHHRGPRGSRPTRTVPPSANSPPRCCAAQAAHAARHGHHHGWTLTWCAVGSHSGNVSATELARLGLMDILSSDYVPGSLLSATLRLTEAAGLGLPQAVALATRNPALLHRPARPRHRLLQALRGRLDTGSYGYARRWPPAGRGACRLARWCAALPDTDRVLQMSFFLQMTDTKYS